MDCIEKFDYIHIEDKKYITLNMMKDVRILDYAIEMVNNNQGNGILYIDKRQLNDDISFLYDVTQYVSFKEYIDSQKVDGMNLLSLFNNLVNVILSMPAYLLNIDNMILDPKYLMVDKVKKSVAVIYVPCEKKVQNTEEEFKQFIKEVIVDCMNTKNHMQYFIREILPIVNNRDYSLNTLAKALSSAGSKNLTTEIKQPEVKEVIPPPPEPEEEPKKAGFFSGLFKHKESKEKVPTTYIIDFDVNGIMENVKIDKPEFVFGRLKGSCDFIVESNVVGKVHAKATIAKHELFIEDLTSKNGTYVNGQRLKGNEKSQLKNGDEVRLGNVKGSVRIF